MDLGFLKWIGHASFLLKADGKNIYIDPFALTTVKEHADIIFITHPHFDHLSLEDLDKIAGPETEIFVPKGSVDEIKKGNAIGVEPNKNYKYGNISFSTIPAYNVVKERLDKHPRKNNWVGYIIEANKIKIYHAGDTDFIEEMKGLTVDLALMPMSGTYTMDVEGAIEAANSMNAKVVAPMHYKQVLGKRASLDAEKRFKEKAKNSIILKEVQEARYSF